MMALKTLSFAALIVSVLAGPISVTESGKPFKIGVTFHGKDTLYLTNTATASPNLADGIECVIKSSTKASGKASNQISCGPDSKAFTYSEAHTMEPLKPVPSNSKNVDWSIDSENVIHWGAQPSGTKSVTFSRQKSGDQKKIFAEVCSTFNHHGSLPGISDFWDRGVPKAYYV